MRQAPAKALLMVAVAAVAGWWVAGRVNAFLDIRFLDKELPQVASVDPPKISLPPPLEPFAAVALPVPDDTLLAVAAAEVAAALEARTGRRPQIAVQPAGRAVEVVYPAAGDGQAHELTGVADGWRLSADGRAGAAHGLFGLADALRSGREQQLLDGGPVAPALPLRLVDMGAVGIRPDTAAWGDDYSHNSRAFDGVIFDGEPYVDWAGLARVEADFDAYLKRMAAYGFNGIVCGGFLGMIDFDGVGNGYEVYVADSAYRRRHAAVRAAYGRLFERARRLGFGVYLRTDMLALTPPLEAYLRRATGAIDAEDPALWRVYRQGLAELLAALPQVDGLMLRIGEAGAVYNRRGSNYYSRLHVRTDAAVRLMLEQLGAEMANRGKRLIFRTWSVGVGQVGDMHTNPTTYRRVLGPLQRPGLLVSTKYVMGDFDSYLPLNPTLFEGAQLRLVEFQARREFEAFNAFPNHLGPLHQAALRRFLAANPAVEGLWLWTQGGGPLRAGPLSLYPFHGFWLPVDLNVYATARLAWDPGADMGRVTADWVGRTFGGGPQAVEALTRLFLDSRQAVLKGLYIGPYARRQVKALGLEPPPMLWIFKWDILSGASAPLSAVYVGARDELDAAVAEGFEAVAAVEGLQALAAGVDAGGLARPDLLALLRASLAYERDLLALLAQYRRAFLNYYAWLEGGGAAHWAQWLAGMGGFERRREAHLGRYAGDLDFPAYAFFAADAGLRHMRRGPTMAWVARLLLAISVGVLAYGVWAGRRGPGAAAWWATAALRPWRLGGARIPGWWLVAPFGLALTAQGVFSSGAAPLYLLVFAVGTGAYCLGGLALWSRDGRGALGAAVGAGLALQAALYLGVVAGRGPVYLWFLLWTAPLFRTVWVTGAVIAVAWSLFGLYAAGRSAGLSERRALAAVLAAAAGPLLVLGLWVWGAGLEAALTGLNDELAVLPLGLSRILGIATHLNIPERLPQYLVGSGALLAAVALLLGRRPGKM